MSLVSRSRGLASAKRSEDGTGFLPCFETMTAQAAAIITFTLSIGLNAATPDPAPPWQAMDYGPFLTASIEAPHPATNIAYKGIAINLGENFGGDHNEAVIFDTDLLRYSAGWTGDFVALKGVVFDGEHWAYPRIAGPQIFGNPSAPGWAHNGRFHGPAGTSPTVRFPKTGPTGMAFTSTAPKSCSPTRSAKCPSSKCPRSNGMATSPRLPASSTSRRPTIDNTVQLLFDPTAARRAARLGKARSRRSRTLRPAKCLAVLAPQAPDTQFPRRQHARQRRRSRRPLGLRRAGWQFRRGHVGPQTHAALEQRQLDRPWPRTIPDWISTESTSPRSPAPTTSRSSTRTSPSPPGSTRPRTARFSPSPPPAINGSPMVAPSSCATGDSRSMWAGSAP